MKIKIIKTSTPITYHKERNTEPTVLKIKQEQQCKICNKLNCICWFDYSQSHSFLLYFNIQPCLSCLAPGLSTWKTPTNTTQGNSHSAQMVARNLARSVATFLPVSEDPPPPSLSLSQGKQSGYITWLFLPLSTFFNYFKKFRVFQKFERTIFDFFFLFQIISVPYVIIYSGKNGLNFHPLRPKLHPPADECTSVANSRARRGRQIHPTASLVLIFSPLPFSLFLLHTLHISSSFFLKICDHSFSDKTLFLFRFLPYKHSSSRAKKKIPNDVMKKQPHPVLDFGMVISRD